MVFRTCYFRLDDTGGLQHKQAQRNKKRVEKIKSNMGRQKRVENQNIRVGPERFRNGNLITLKKKLVAEILVIHLEMSGSPK